MMGRQREAKKEGEAEMILLTGQLQGVTTVGDWSSITEEFYLWYATTVLMLILFCQGRSYMPIVNSRIVAGERESKLCKA